MSLTWTSHGSILNTHKLFSLQSLAKAMVTGDVGNHPSEHQQGGELTLFFRRLGLNLLWGWYLIALGRNLGLRWTLRVSHWIEAQMGGRG